MPYPVASWQLATNSSYDRKTPYYNTPLLEVAKSAKWNCLRFASGSPKPGKTLQMSPLRSPFASAALQIPRMAHTATKRGKMTGNPTMFLGRGLYSRVEGEMSLKYPKRAICLNTFVAHCKTKNDWTPETTENREAPRWITNTTAWIREDKRKGWICFRGRE